VKILILLVLVAIAVQLYWNARRLRSGFANVRTVQNMHQVIEQTMVKFGEQRELLKELQTQFSSQNSDEDSRIKWSLVEHWKQESIKRLCDFDFAGALALMTHAVEQARRVLVDTQSASPSISVRHVRAFLERQRLGVSLKTASLELF
jgi:hypothetical protein